MRSSWWGWVRFIEPGSLERRGEGRQSSQCVLADSKLCRGPRFSLKQKLMVKFVQGSELGRWEISVWRSDKDPSIPFFKNTFSFNGYTAKFLII